jgi:hypothetical protein
MLNDFIFILLGGLLLALRNRVAPPVHLGGWIVVGAALAAWGVRTALWPRRGISRWDARLQGIALALAGVLAVTIALAPPRYFPALIALIGAVLIVRGLVGVAFRGLAPRSVTKSNL